MMNSIQGHSTTSRRLRMACVVYGALIVFELTLCARRLAGGFEPTEFTVFFSTVLIVTLLTGIGCYFLLPDVVRQRDKRLQIFLAVGSVLPAAVLTFALIESIDSFTMGGILFLGFAIPVLLFFADRSRPVFDSTLPELSHVETPYEETEQSIKRWFADDRTDCMEGFVTARFLPGQKHANVHVPFQPGFETVPEVECYETTDTSSHIKVALVRSYGMRIELQRTESLDSPEIVKLHFEAAARKSHNL